jgi:hypothetical protein
VFCDQLRSIPSLQCFGSLGKRGLEDPVFWTGNETPSGLIDRPFENEDELNYAMAQKYLYNNLPSQNAEFYRYAFPIVLKYYKPVFTHCDLQRKNIMIRKGSTTGYAKEDNIKDERQCFKPRQLGSRFENPLSLAYESHRCELKLLHTAQARRKIWQLEVLTTEKCRVYHVNR